jgi:multisubunit Na+/H+ antiporter MnhB subunit
MQAIMEPIFHVVYLTTVITLGIKMLCKSKDNQYFKLFGAMAVILGFGDSFHLIPRIYALLTTGLENNAPALGFGKLVTSITMIIFYLILYKIWKIRFDVKDSKTLDIIMYVLAGLRIILCLFPQNQWFANNPPVSWGIYRNIPFAIMGIIMIYLLYSYGTKNNDKDYKNLGIAVLLSFGFYAPVVIWASENFLVGMLMIPKTLAYVWVVLIGYKEFKKSIK